MDNGAEYYRRYLDGDDSGFTELVRLYMNGLIFFVNGYVKNASAAEDITEDTFFTLAVKKPRYIDGASFRTWLYTIARNKALNYLRTQARRRAVPIDEAAELASEQNIEAEILRTEQKRRLHAAIEQLKPEYREVLHLIYFEQLDTSNTAQVMKKSPRQVTNLLYRAKQALKTKLEQEGFEYEEL